MSLPSEAPRRHVRVAIVGSGLTGLVATYLLTASQPHAPDAPRISVDIFERAPTLGMDSASITVPLSPASPQQPEAAPPRLVKRARLDAKSDKATDVATWMRIDVPMRAFTGGYYPQLLALYRHLGIRARKTNFTYSFARIAEASAVKGERKAPEPRLLYNGANGVRGISLPHNLMRLRKQGEQGYVRLSAVLECVRRCRVYFGSLVVVVLGYVQLLIIALWHSTLGHTADAHHPLRTHTLRDLVRDPFPARPARGSSKLRWGAERMAEMVLRRVAGLDERFVEQTLAPLFSAVMTCSLDAVWASPATEVLDYVALTLGRDHFVVQDGVRTVVRALLVHVTPGEEESRVWTRAQVCRVHHRHGRAWLSVMHHAEGTQMSREPSNSSASTGTDTTCIDDAREHGPFDHVIFATQANQTARFLEAYAASLGDVAERRRVREVVEALRTVRYERSVVVNHTDRTMLPVNRRDWRDLNLVSPAPAPSGEMGLGRRGSAGSDWTDSSSDSSNTEAGQEGHTMATHVLRVPSYARVVMQTTNPHRSLEPSEDSVLSRAGFERAVLDVRAHVARQTLFTRTIRHSRNADAVQTAGGTQLQLGPLQPVRAATEHAQVWVAGSWASGIPLLEGCVVSATLVAKSIVSAEGASLPSSATW